MQELEIDNVINQIKNNQLDYNQFYNVDVDIPEYYSIQHYTKFPNDLNINQKLSIVFLDIEVFSNHTGNFLPSNAISPISAITLYNSKDNTYYSYFLILSQIKHLLTNIDTSKFIKELKKDLIENKYIPENEEFKVFFFESEIQLLEQFWIKVHEIDPVCLSGYYSDMYDIPYIYNRLKNLYNNDGDKVAATMSKLKLIKIRKMGDKVTIQIPEYPILDIKHLYCPRGEGGLNYGKSQSSYSLDFISDQELKLKKLDYKQEGNSNLDTFYLNDPINYFKYNIIDVILTVRLNDKLDHINFHNILRRDMKCPLTQSIRGTSALFSSMFAYEIQKLNQYFRYGIHKEVEHDIDQVEISQIEQPKTKTIKKWTVKSINNQIIRKILSKYPGAYVAQGYNKIITLKDDESIVVDSDASLPPWEKIFIKRNNKIYWGDIKNYNFIPGDLTLTWDENNNTCWKNAKGKTEHFWDGELITIITETGKKGTVTSNHSIFGAQQGIKSNESYLIDAGKLKLEDYVIGFKQFDLENLETVGLEKIVKITRQKYKGLVYDISVDETERFFAGTGIGVHNTALYPNTMKMYNISFDALFGYIINSKSYNFLKYLNTILGKKQKINPTIKNDIFSKIDVKINNLAPQNKNNHKQYYFYTFYHLLNILNNANVPLNTIMNPKNIHHYILLKSYLMPLLHLFSEIVTLDEYHPDMYKYIVNNEELDYDLFIIQNINQTNINIIKLPGKQLATYLKETEVNINLSGALFYTHEKYTGLLNKFITNKLEFRKKYKTKRDMFVVGSDDYIFYDNRQKSAKVNANSSYGLSGLSSFIYSNRLCAASTTLSGRLTLKLAQVASEQYIESTLKN